MNIYEFMHSNQVLVFLIVFGIVIIVETICKAVVKSIAIKEDEK